MISIIKIKKSILECKYARFFNIFASLFALIYHITALVVFRLVGVMPMFYFNFFSVSLFSVIFFVILKTDDDFFIKIFPFFYLEVVIHQILADYFLGADASFHFFILLTGILPVLTFKKRIDLAVVYGLISVLLFAIIEIISTEINVKYDIAPIIIRIIKSINVILTVFVIVGALLLNSVGLWHKQYSLESTVQRQQIKAAIQSKKIMTMQNNIINSLASLVENRDLDTGEHIQRTSAYVELISREALKRGLFPETITEEFIPLMRRAAPLHDIGKIMVSDNVLKKPGRLTPEEFELIKIHTREGGRIIKEVVGIHEDKNFVRIASEVATYHHEKWNGSGYPYGTAGEDIPISARIMAVADVFDALVSTRCYKDKMPVNEAFDIIKNDSGSHFDPVFAEIFLSMRDEVEKVMSKFTR